MATPQAEAFFSLVCFTCQEADSHQVSSFQEH